MLGHLTDGFLNITAAESFLYLCFLGLGILIVSLSSKRNWGFFPSVFFFFTLKFIAPVVQKTWEGKKSRTGKPKRNILFYWEFVQPKFEDSVHLPRISSCHCFFRAICHILNTWTVFTAKWSGVRLPVHP